MSKKHSLILLYGMAALLPGLAMVAGHWFPWRAVLGRDLTRLEAYAYGVAWIVGVAGAAMRLSARLGQPATPDECARLGEVAVASAGTATILAYTLDAWIGARRRHLAHTLVRQQKGQ